MPIVLDNPNASVGRGIHEAGGALAGALNRYRKEGEDERRTKEREERAEGRQKNLLQFQEELREGREAQARERNKMQGGVVDQILSEYTANLPPGQEISPFDAMGLVSRIQKETGMDFNKAANALNTYQNQVDLQERRKLREEQAEERKVAREERFRNEVLAKRPELQGEDLEDYFEMARQYDSISDPQKRFRAADEKYKEAQKRFQKFQQELEGPGFVERAITGLDDKRLKQLQNKVKLLKGDFREEKIVNALQGAGFEEMEIERIIAPLSQGETQSLKSIPKAIPNVAFTANQASVNQQRRNQQVERLPAFLQNAVADGGSIRLIAEGLVEKGYSRDEIGQAFANLMDNVDLTPRQQAQVLEITRKPKTRSLGQIFGF